jgi:hypothetical protein
MVEMTKMQSVQTPEGRQELLRAPLLATTSSHNMSDLSTQEAHETHGDIAGLYNDSVTSFHWKGVNAVLPAHGSVWEKKLLDDVSGYALAGE